MRDFKLAAVIMRSIVGDIDGNLNSLAGFAARAAGEGAGLVVFPEACLTGYTVRSPMHGSAESIPGPLTDAVKSIAADHNLIISAGLVEKANADRCCLTQVLIGPDGIIDAYRKTHLGPTEKSLFLPGNELSVVDCDHARLGIQLCYEGHFPEMSQAQALSGAEVILVPHASPRENPVDKLERWLRYLPARAYDNSVFLAACNQTGDNGDGVDFSGAAMIIGPKGEILAKAASKKEAMITAELNVKDLAAVRNSRMGYFLPLRRPEIYNAK